MCARCWHAYLQNEALVDRELACHVMQRFDNWLYTKTPRLSMCFVHLAVLGAQQVAALYRAHTSCLQKGAIKQNHHHQLLLRHHSAVPAQRGIAVALARRL
jgi:hypothetical protein